MAMNTLMISICLLVPLGVLGHGQLTVPLVRGDSQGRRESYEQRAPVFTLAGNRDGYSATSMRCHDFSPDTPQTTLQAGETFEATWTMEAGHPGDCYFYLSYDSDPNNAVNFFKFAAIPGCGATDGLNIPASVTTTILLPPEVPACEHCVLRWEWTAHQQVVDIEFYVQCADVKITSNAGPTLPSPTTAIAGIEHLPQDASGYRKVYNGQGPEQQYLVGPPVATYSICSIGAPGCISEVGLALIDQSTSQPATSASLSSASPEPHPTTASATGSDGAGECTCTASTEWNGGFARYAMGEDFCSQNFGGANPWISGGSNGGFSGPAACTKEYTFKDNHWQIFVGEDALGKAPHRAFAYAQFCNGKAYKECWTSEKVTFSFSLMVEGLSLIGAYVKVLFWTDAGNILGLLPSSHPKGEGKLRLITFMTDDYPNSWTAEKEIEESVWYHIQVVFTPATGAVELQLDSQPLDSGSIPVNMLDATSGPQMGVYSFDYATQSWPADGLKLYLGDACVGTVSGSCPSGTSSDAPSSTSAANPSSEGTISSATTSPTSATSPTGDTSTVTASNGEVVPSTSRTGLPAQGNFDSSTCPLPGMGLPSFVSECYCGFVTSSAGDGCGPDDGTACWCRCCCHFRGGTCRYSELEVFDSSRTFALCKWVMLALAMLHGFSA